MFVDSQLCLKLTGFYRGKVLKHLPQGKLKVFIYGVYDDQYDSYEGSEYLPECEIAAPLFGGNNYGNGMFSYPNLGTTVWCFFLNGDQNYPVCFSCTQGGLNEGVKQYNKVITSVDEQDVIDGTDTLVHVINSGTSRIEIYQSGQINILTKGESSESNIKICGNQGSILIYSSSGIELKSKRITMNADDDVVINTNKYTVNANLLMNLHTNLYKLNADTAIHNNAKSIKQYADSDILIESTAIKIEGKDVIIKGNQEVKQF